MKILCFGNSFSVDANEYLFSIARAGGADIEVLNLNIPSCSLEMHARNILDDTGVYNVEYNGREYADRHASAAEGLLFRDWDVVTIQQVSELSGLYDTYLPHVFTLNEKIRELCPGARILLHQAWAYEKDRDHPEFDIYDRDQEKMHRAIQDTCRRAVRELPLDGLIPSGDVIARLREYDCFDIDKGGRSLSRDGIHLSLTYGRYAAAAAWCEALGLCDMAENSFVPPFLENGELEGERLLLIKQTVKEIAKNSTAV